MSALTLHIEGIGWWSPELADWAALATRLRAGEAMPADAEHGAAARARPPAAVLPPNERRRAPEPVLLACEAAAQACAMANQDPATLPCVFSSVHGDLAITEDMCMTLARDPRELSPTRFHNSVHNAPAGYWTVATGCHAASSAVSAWQRSFAAGLFEAAAQACAEQTPVLYAAYDATVGGPLGAAVRSSPAFAVAFVLAPERTPRALATLHLRHVPGEPSAFAYGSDAALPLLAALARGGAGSLRLASGAASSLAIEVAA
ncbi:MAG: hypothetical protein EOP90_05735 [Lysobacteraceae bacterium]|nr:MAG: hypothetical protein EOP90_05735 [Xanthomonadaceae bacterium]